MVPEAFATTPLPNTDTPQAEPATAAAPVQKKRDPFEAAWDRLDAGSRKDNADAPAFTQAKYALVAMRHLVSMETYYAEAIGTGSADVKKRLELQLSSARKTSREAFKQSEMSMQSGPALNGAGEILLPLFAQLHLVNSSLERGDIAEAKGRIDAAVIFAGESPEIPCS